jgi:hypothetical protein
MVMHYVGSGRRLHDKTQQDINAMAQKAWLEQSGAHGAVEGHGHPGFQPANNMPTVITEGIERQEIIQTPEGRPMAIAKSMSRILHRAESGGANDWEMVTVPGGRSFIRSPTKGHQEWLDIVVSGEQEAWPSPPPESKEHEATRLAMEEEANKLAMVLAEQSAMAAKAMANAAAEAIMAKALADANDRDEVARAQALAHMAAEAAKSQELAGQNVKLQADLQAAEAMNVSYKLMAAELAHFRQQHADMNLKTLTAEAEAKAKAWDDKLKLAMEKEAATAEAEAKAKAWDDKMKLAMAQEAADNAKEALHKQAMDEHDTAIEQAADKAFKQKAAERQELAAKEQADMAAKEQADMAAKAHADIASKEQADMAAREQADMTAMDQADMTARETEMGAKAQMAQTAKEQKVVNLLGMMALQVKRSV